MAASATGRARRACCRSRLGGGCLRAPLPAQNIVAAAHTARRAAGDRAQPGSTGRARARAHCRGPRQRRRGARALSLGRGTHRRGGGRGADLLARTRGGGAQQRRGRGLGQQAAQARQQPRRRGRQQLRVRRVVLAWGACALALLARGASRSHSRRARAHAHRAHRGPRNLMTRSLGVSGCDWCAHTSCRGWARVRLLRSARAVARQADRARRHSALSCCCRYVSMWARRGGGRGGAPSESATTRSASGPKLAPGRPP